MATIFANPKARIANLIAALRPKPPYFVDDLTRSSENELLRAGVAPAVKLLRLALRFVGRRESEGALAALQRWGDLLRSVDRDPGPESRDILTAIQWYCLQQTEIPLKQLQAAFSKLLQRPEEDMISTAERIRLEGETLGRRAMLLRLIEKRFGTPPTNMLDRVAAASIEELDVMAERILDVETIAELLAP